MALLGTVVVVHGVVLLTPYADRLGSASGPLMIVYSLLMLLNQALVGATGSMNWGWQQHEPRDERRDGFWHDRRNGLGSWDGSTRSPDVNQWDNHDESSRWRFRNVGSSLPRP